MDNTDQFNEDLNLLIIGYLTGSINDAEKEILTKWVNSDKVNEFQFNTLCSAWIIAGAEKGKAEFNSESAWEKLGKDISGENHCQTKPEKENFSSEYLKYLRIAASWLIFFSLGLTAMYFFKANPRSLSQNKVTISVPLGAKSDVLLPDGSRVWLNAGTQITYAHDYGDKNRSLDLIGEAYFEVANDKNLPFIVNASEVKVLALGTKFNVKAYPEENNILATLEEGKIQVQVTNPDGETTSTILLPNENILYYKSGEVFVKPSLKKEVKAKVENLINTVKPVEPAEIKVIKNVNTKLFTSWKEERWIIENEQFGTLAPMLERRFNVKIIFSSDELKQNRFTGTIQNETIEQLMNAFKLTAPVDYILKKDTVLLKVDTVMQDQFRQITRQNN